MTLKKTNFKNNWLIKKIVIHPNTKQTQKKSNFRNNLLIKKKSYSKDSGQEKNSETPENEEKRKAIHFPSSEPSLLLRARVCVCVCVYMWILDIRCIRGISHLLLMRRST